MLMLPDTMFGLKLFVDDLPVPPVRRPDTSLVFGHQKLRIAMVPKRVKLHRDLDPTDLWSYACLNNSGQPFPEDVAHHLGPTIETSNDAKVLVEWVHRIPNSMKLPVQVRTSKADPQNVPQNRPGGNGTAPAARDPTGIEAYCVAHLHGGRTRPDSDGWTDNVLASDPPGQSKLSQYGPEPRAMMLWYHDHAMGLTRVNVMAGLSGTWLVRNAAEKALKLPQGPFEVPLALRDCNLVGDAAGNLLPGTVAKFSGQLLHKVETESAPGAEDTTNEFFGPFTMVNGKIWPHKHVKRGVYRFRVLNAANARTFGLVLQDAQGNLRNDLITLIGTDGGFVDKPTTFAANQPLVLASAERVDILVDFSGLAVGDQLTLLNLVNSPYKGPAAGASPPIADPTQTFPQVGFDRLAEPRVMQFQVVAGSGSTFKLTSLPPNLPTDYSPIVHKTFPHEHDSHHTMLLVEANGELTFRELIEAKAGPVAITHAGSTTHYKVVASNFNDTTSIFAKRGSNQVWKLINLSADTHPFHVHQVQFRIIGRSPVDNIKFTPTTGPTAGQETDNFDATTDATINGPLDVKLLIDGSPDPVELGWKDTLRANPGEMLTIGIENVGPYCGRYMYHCHVLEHEDMDMMRPWVILPERVAEWMADMGGMHHMA
jgi:FtsP/CotA-like multicopper oxidase with cupredoxin domain